MTRLEDRQRLLATIREAQDVGSLQEPACAVAGIDARTIQRWQNEDRTMRDDGRPGAVHPPSAHALTEAERTRIVAASDLLARAVHPARTSLPVLAKSGAGTRRFCQLSCMGVGCTCI